MNTGECTGEIKESDFHVKPSVFRLLDMLAFKPEFIRTLWYTLLTSKSHKNQLSISILSRGIQIRKSIKSFSALGPRFN
jgi:hypothetical protein